MLDRRGSFVPQEKNPEYFISHVGSAIVGFPSHLRPGMDGFFWVTHRGHAIALRPGKVRVPPAFLTA